MRMPTKARYKSGEEFLSALNLWMKKEEEAYQHLRGMFDATLESKEKPNWFSVADGKSLKWVWTSAKPDAENIEPILRNLSGDIVHHEQKIIRLAHGPSDENGQNGWAVWAWVEPA